MADHFETGIRKANESDRNFIFSTWLRSFKQYSYFAKRIKNPIFFKWHQQLIERVLARDTTTTLIIHKKDDTDLIVGYLVYEDWDDFDVIHFLYVKGPYQRNGFSKLLIDASQIDMGIALFTHWTYCVDEFNLLEKYPNLTYSPYHI